MKDNSRIILGTANFGNLYSGTLVNRPGCVAILQEAQRLGIQHVETAFSYGEAVTWIGEIITEYKLDLKVILKARTGKEFKEAEQKLGFKPYLKMFHGFPEIGMTPNRNADVKAVSIYTVEEFYEALRRGGRRIFEYPYSIFDRRFQGLPVYDDGKRIVHIARSVFLRGKAFKAQIARYAWNFVAVDEQIDYICVGVELPSQIEEICSWPEFQIRYTEGGFELEPLAEVSEEKVMLPHNRLGDGG